MGLYNGHAAQSHICLAFSDADAKDEYNIGGKRIRQTWTMATMDYLA